MHHDINGAHKIAILGWISCILSSIIKRKIVTPCCASFRDPSSWIPIPSFLSVIWLHHVHQHPSLVIIVLPHCIVYLVFIILKYSYSELRIQNCFIRMALAWSRSINHPSPETVMAAVISAQSLLNSCSKQCWAKIFRIYFASWVVYGSLLSTLNMQDFFVFWLLKF